MSCLAGYWQNGESCSPCREFCLICTSSNNCLKCSDGYQLLASAGTYCSPCFKGCKTCTSPVVCTACMPNYILTNYSCLSLANQCSNIPNCQTCAYSSNNTISCVLCSYPYFLQYNNGVEVCAVGASMMCTNGAIGVSRA
jgi:hypothetical protein